MWQAGVVMRLRGGAAAHQQIVGRVSELDELRRRVLAHRGYDVAPPHRLLRHAVLCRRCTLHHRMLLGERRATTALRRATIFHRSAIFRRRAALRRSAIRRLHRGNALRRAAILLLHVDRLACTTRRAPT